MNEFQQKLTQLIVDTLQDGESCWVEITSRSMSPLFQIGDQILIKPIPITQLQPGMLSLIWPGDQLLLHRFWGEKDAQLLTGADRVIAFDPYWSQSQFLGIPIQRQRANKIVDLTDRLPSLYNRLIFKFIQFELRHYDITPQFKPNDWLKTMHRLLILPFILLEQMIQ